MTDRRKKAPVQHTTLPRTLLAQSTQPVAGVPPEQSDHDPQEKRHKNPTRSHVTQNSRLHELVSAKKGQGGSPLFYGITCKACVALAAARRSTYAPLTSAPSSIPRAATIVENSKLEPAVRAGEFGQEKKVSSCATRSGPVSAKDATTGSNFS
jgi:type IV secretory pathway VirJ component